MVFKSGAHHEDQEDHEDREDHEVHVDQEDQEKAPDSRIPPTPITQRDMDIIIRGWEEKFSKIVECLREVQLTSERASSEGQHAATVPHLRVPDIASGPGGGFPSTQLVAALRECAHRGRG